MFSVDLKIYSLAEHSPDKRTPVFFHSATSHSAVHIHTTGQQNPLLAIEHFQWEMGVACSDRGHLIGGAQEVVASQ